METFKRWSNAARNLRHYLGNSGDDLSIDPDQIGSEVPQFKDLMDGHARTVATDAAKGAIAGGTFDCAVAFTSNWTGFYIKQEWSEDWYYANYGVNLAVTGTVTVHQGNPPDVEVSYIMHLYDNYNWDTEQDKFVNIGPIKVEDEQLAKLHRAGVAKEYRVVGSSQVHTYRCSLEGSCPSTIQPGSGGGGR